MKAVYVSLLCCSTLAAATITQPKFLARRDYGSSIPGAGPDGFVAVADINGDKIPDIVAVVAEYVFTLLGNGDGSFRTGPSMHPRLSMNNVVPIDLNGDGKTDLIVSGDGSGTGGAGIAVYFGNGDGTFQSPVAYGVPDSYMGWVVVGDFNGDGIPDAVLAGTLGIWFFAGQAGGTFSPGVLTPISGIAPRSFVSADFNGDGKLDLAVPVPSGFDVLFGNGDGTFQAPVTYKATSFPGWMAVGDLNRDGHPDLVVGAGPSVYLNKGDGTFASPIPVDLPGPQFNVGDLNGDKIPDLVSSTGYVAFGLGNGHFESPVYYPVETSLTSANVVMAHLRGPNYTDLVFGENSGVSVLLNEGKGTFADGVWTSVPGSGNCGAAADFNGDGIGDLGVPTSQGIVILLGTGNGKAPFTTGTTIPLSSPGCPITGDVNGDGIPDILEGAGSLGGVGVYLGNGDGTFRLASVIPLSPANNMVLGDFNHDGKLDLATSSNQMAFGNGDGTFQAPVPILTNPPPLGFMWIAAGDMNNDGWTDIVATEGDFEANMYVLLNNQQGGFTITTAATNESGFVLCRAGRSERRRQSGRSGPDRRMGSGLHGEWEGRIDAGTGRGCIPWA